MLDNKILIVDDEPKLLSEILPAYGYEVDVCTNGAEAIKLLQSKKTQFKLIILDINMPIMDGWQVLKAIRNDSYFNNLPVLMLTGADEDGSEVTGLGCGADDYICKPVRIPALLARIENLIKRYDTETNKSLDQLANMLHSNEYNLSAREKETLKFVVDGDNNNQIAEAMSIKEDTVKAHLKSIFKKLEVNNRIQAAVIAVKNKLLS